MERREYTRIVVELRSALQWPDGSTSTGTTRDLSFGGAYFDSKDAPATLHAELPVRGCILGIDFGSSQGGVASIRCDLVDITGERLGLRFAGAEEPDYERLRAGLLELATDPQALLKEMQDFPNPAFTQPLLPTFKTWLARMLARLRE